MIKNGAIIKTPNGIVMIDSTKKKNGLPYAVKLIRADRISFDYEPQDTEKYPQIGSVSIVRTRTSPGGSRFCNCIIALNNGADLPVSVLTRESRNGPEITSVFEIRRLAFTREGVHEFLKDNSEPKESKQVQELEEPVASLKAEPTAVTIDGTRIRQSLFKHPNPLRINVAETKAVIRKGIEILDRIIPDWRKRIDWHEFNSSFQGVLQQLYKYNTKAAEKATGVLWHRWPQFGFHFEWQHLSHSEITYHREIETALWKEETFWNQVMAAEKRNATIVDRMEIPCHNYTHPVFVFDVEGQRYMSRATYMELVTDNQPDCAEYLYTDGFFLICEGGGVIGLASREVGHAGWELPWPGFPARLEAGTGAATPLSEGGKALSSPDNMSGVSEG